MSRTPYRVLLVDDDETVLFCCKQSLTKSGYHVSEASTLNDAKQEVADDDYDIVLLSNSPTVMRLNGSPN